MDLSATGELKVQAWQRWTVGALLMEDLGWRLGNCELTVPMSSFSLKLKIY